MTNYVVNHRKKKNILEKREREIYHAIKHNVAHARVSHIAEKIRETKLSIYKMNFSRSTTLPASSYEPSGEALVWQRMSVEEIIDRYRNAE